MPSYAIGETMIWPLDKKWRSISSNYGYRTHPITGEKESFHGAIDIPASKSENIYAAHSGIVITATYNWSYGNYVIIDHGEIANSTDHLYTLYAHASELLVENGDTVKQGDVIAKVGETGSAKGNHLHFEVRSGNSKVEPLKFVKQP
jgi:murein DD-endopeptidase MepM/ murein hydrolase activator NlpD